MNRAKLYKSMPFYAKLEIFTMLSRNAEKGEKPSQSRQTWQRKVKKMFICHGNICRSPLPTCTSGFCEEAGACG